MDTVHSLLSVKLHEVIKTNLSPLSKKSVIAWPNLNSPLAYLKDDGNPSIVLKNDVFEFHETEGVDNTWEEGLKLQALWRTLCLHPEKTNDYWLPLVQNSFKSKIMSPVTSYISLENEAQRQALLEKQKKTLNSKKSLDIGEEARQMSEPSLIILVLIILLFIIIKNRKKIFSSSKPVLL
jgi:hypothetical protein